MVFTEVRNINGKKYYYRVVSIRNGNKISKKRLYLGSELSGSELKKKQEVADEKLLSKKIKPNKEIEAIKKKLTPILKKNHVVKAGIFGSYSRGEQKKSSDIDILIQINPAYKDKISLLDIIRLQLYIEKKLGKKVDLVEYSALHHLLKNRILKEEVNII